MRRAAIAALLLAACASSRTTSPSSVPGHAALSMTIIPNPIVARPVGSNGIYEFPFDVEIRESGGHAAKIDELVVDVYAFGGRMRVASESYNAAKIAAEGYPTTVPANGVLRFHFAPRHPVGDERLFGGVTGEVRLDATDDTGAPATARVNVTVTK